MPLWKRKTPAANVVSDRPDPPGPAPLAPLPELDELETLLPNRDAKGRFFWQDYVDRIRACFDGLPSPDEKTSLVGECLAAGCRAIAAMERSAHWEHRAPPVSDRKARAVFELRMRLGLFFAASLRCLTQSACRLRVKAGDAEWQPLPGYGMTYRGFLAAHGGKPDVTWSEAAPHFGQVCLLANSLLRFREVTLVSFDLAAEVHDYLRPQKPAGRFSIMLGRTEGENGSVDVAAVFLEALVNAVNGKRLRVNTRRMGHVFVHPVFWFVTYPAGVGDVARLIRRGRMGTCHDFTRDQIVQALRAQGCLLWTDPEGAGSAVRTCELDSDDWLLPLTLNGLMIRTGSLAERRVTPPFDGTVILKDAGAGEELIAPKSTTREKA